MEWPFKTKLVSRVEWPFKTENLYQGWSGPLKEKRVEWPFKIFTYLLFHCAVAAADLVYCKTILIHKHRASK